MQIQGGYGQRSYLATPRIWEVKGSEVTEEVKGSEVTTQEVKGSEVTTLIQEVKGSEVTKKRWQQKGNHRVEVKTALE